MKHNTMQILYANLASGSSRVSRFSQSVDMMLSYLFGYFRKISYIIAIINLIYRLSTTSKTYIMHTHYNLPLLLYSKFNATSYFACKCTVTLMFEFLKFSVAKKEHTPCKEATLQVLQF